MAFERIFNNLYVTFSEGEINIVVVLFHRKQSDGLAS